MDSIIDGIGNTVGAHRFAELERQPVRRTRLTDVSRLV
jgi:hypothetical protein